MKVISVSGITKTGKTTTIENIIKELVRRGYSVGTVKEIHNEAFAIDSEGKNTYRHRQAGAGTVTALGYYETDVLYKGKMDIYDVLKHYTEDFVILEGVENANVPNIATAKQVEDLKDNDLTFLISGVIANSVKDEIKSLQVLSAIDDIKEIVDKILEVTPDLMPKMDIDCCGSCGMSCRELLKAIIKGKAKVTDCVIRTKNKVKLSINGKDVYIVPFVDKILYNEIMGVVKELKGFFKGSTIEIKL